MTSTRVPRSYLFVPASRPERIGKAIAAGADAVIVDLEDAVAPDAKAAARAGLAEPWRDLQAQADAAGVALLLRINGADTSYFAEDVSFCRAGGVREIVLPKADKAALAALRAELPETPCCALLESAAGFADLAHVARAPGVSRLLFGSIDLMFDLDVGDDDAPLHHFRSELVMHSRAAGLPAPVDGVCTAIGDADALAADTARARRFGFGAKLLIHPNQVGGVHAALAPSAEELAWARRVVEQAAAAQGAAIAVDGKMVDRPVLERAQRIVAAGAA
ncbi:MULTISPECIES: HpcH/HpaI aldolase/citrate lyase family protein [Cupriavidus]|uniref:CoA ester lyase n=1 Tax=Cupriavidus metallidurans TaxID=119219 RepID=A0A482IWA6_9BURK|nr:MULTISPECIES: aldolase/citrate lyase family protein [Cupriavidus]KWR86990.1 aldolase [Cupriavidus sp. SHE]QBP11863.1 CoA ester lyase [Cupriavidus metallidurans]QWC91831.1 CoA ester lyase [Cupriavidus metallidurans]